MVLGADGANSLVRRRLATAFERSQISIATGYFAHGISSREIAIRFTTRPAGYCWSFPRPDHLAIGICAQANLTGVSTLRRDVEAWIDRQPIGPTARLERYSWPIPSLDASDIDREQPAGDRWMLLGDAAGLVDPITREGIYFALRSAELAAAAIVEDPHPTHAYAAAIRDDIHGELRRAARLKRAFFTPRFLHLLHDALRQSAAVRAVMADLVAGRQPYRGLKRRLLGTMEVGLAWRLITRRG
jgi:flavin-dependent dehydrogenase